MQVLVDQSIGANQLLNFLDRSAVRDQLRCGRHVDAVNIGVTHRRRRRCKIHLARTRLSRKLDDLPGRRATDDRIIDEQNVLAVKLQPDRIEFVAH